MSTNSQEAQGLTSVTSPSSRDSKSPLLPRHDAEHSAMGAEEHIHDKEGKLRKRDFFKFGKKAEEDKKGKTKVSNTPITTSSVSGAVDGLQPVSPPPGVPSLHSTSSPPLNTPYSMPASPGRQRLQSASPRALSPSTSQIFERSVQEDVPVQASPQIPSHIITENHIPPALDASSEAITNSKLNPDIVEIVTHVNHQPAAAVIPGAADPSMMSSIHEDHMAHITRHDTDNVSNYGSLDVGDIRRLSFISFADVVHAEQEMEDQRRDSTPMPSLGGHPALAVPRSPSPAPSPATSHTVGSPLSATRSPSVKGQEASPTRGLRGTVGHLSGQSSPLATNELNIETMRQALRKTGSGDLSIYRSAPTSAVGPSH